MTIAFFSLSVGLPSHPWEYFFSCDVVDVSVTIAARGLRALCRPFRGNDANRNGRQMGSPAALMLSPAGATYFAKSGNLELHFLQKSRNEVTGG